MLFFNVFTEIIMLKAYCTNSYIYWCDSMPLQKQMLYVPTVVIKVSEQRKDEAKDHCSCFFAMSSLSLWVSKTWTMEEEAGLEAVAAEPKAAPCKNLKYFISHYVLGLVACFLDVFI